MQFRLLLKLLCVSLVGALKLNFGLSHEVAALVGLLYQILGSLHFRLMVEDAAAQVLFLLAFETKHVFCFPARFFHFPDGLLLFFFEKLYPISQFQYVLFLLEARSSGLLPVGEAPEFGTRRFDSVLRITTVLSV